MKVQVLVENTALNPEFGSEHGLSLYIETRKHRLLFDVGQTGLFLENAKKMHVNIASVDTLVISHGHYDHGGGIATFFAQNERAQVYVNEHAFEPYFSIHEGDQIDSIGLDPAVTANARVQKAARELKLDDELTLFSGVSRGPFWPPANRTLLKSVPDGYAPDDFLHEQNLIITEDGEDVLFTGCAHNGIVHIMKAACALRGRAPRAVIGGFHLCLKEDFSDEDAQFALQVADELSKYDTTYFTGHCTGEGGVRLLKEKLPGRLNRLSAGMVFNL